MAYIKGLLMKILTFLSLFAFGLANAQTLHFLSGTVDASGPGIESLEQLEQPSVDGRLVVIGVAERTADVDRSCLTGQDVQVARYLPDNGFLISVPSGISVAEIRSCGFSAVLAWEPEWKIHPELATTDFGKREEVELDVNILPGFEKNRTVSAFFEPLLSIDLGDYHQIRRITIPAKDIDELASQPFVEWIAYAAPEPKPDNLYGRTLHRSNVLSNGTLGTEFNGEGIVIMVQDDGEIGPHIDFNGRLNQTSSSASQGDHGDHVAGTVGAAGNIDPDGRGMAWGADLHIYRASPSYNGFVNIDDAYTQRGIRITSTSYSDGCNGGYTGFTEAMDQHAVDYPSLLHVFSAGNSGADDCGYGAGAGWGNITGGHKAGKNVIAVANLGSTDGLASSSSRGPAHDGRIKPDVAAMGSNVYSTVENYDYGFKSGTSMSAPGTSGTLGQLYQVWSEQFGTEPPGDHMKAILLNSTDDLGNPGPDYLFGFGRINARRGAQCIMNNWFQSNAISDGNIQTHTISVPANTSRLKVMLYWHDPAASPSVSKALINNLDVRVVSPSASMHLPLVPDPTPNPSNLNAPATESLDTLNNAEQVIIQNPATGAYTVEVEGTSVPMGPQNYVIVYQIESNEVELTYPTGNEKMTPGTSELIRWDASDSTLDFMLQYSVDDGQSWNFIAHPSPNQRYYNWTVPDSLTSEARIRVVRDTQIDMSDTTFQILETPQNLNVDWVCPDSIQLSWSPVDSADWYEISQIGQKYMDSIAVTTDTFLVIQNIDPWVDTWFSARGVFADGKKGKRAYAVRKPTTVTDCPLPFDAQLLAIDVPPAGMLYDCHDLSNISPTVRIYNIGTDTIPSGNVFYQLNTGTPQSSPFAGPIAPGDTFEFTMPISIDLSMLANYTNTVWLDITGDENAFNDTLQSITYVRGGTAVSIPYTDDFESYQNCNDASNCGQTDCILWGSDWVNAENGQVDNIDWRVDNEGTPSSFTGPLEDYEPGTSTGKYLYLEASGGCEGRVAELLTPCLQLPGGTSLVLRYGAFMFGVDIGELHVDLFDGTKWVEDIHPPFTGNIGFLWNDVTVDLSPWAGSIVNIRFRGITGDGPISDIAIDGVRIEQGVSIVEQPLPVIQLYPNPASERLTIRSSESLEGTVVILDVSGRSVAQETMNGTVLELDISDLSTGVYTVTIMDADGQKVTERLLKQ